MSSAEERKKAKEAYLKSLEAQKKENAPPKVDQEVRLDRQVAREQNFVADTGKPQDLDIGSNRSANDQILAAKRNQVFEEKRRKFLSGEANQSRAPDEINLKNFKREGYPSEYSYAQAMGLLEINSKNTDSNNVPNNRLANIGDNNAPSVPSLNSIINNNVKPLNYPQNPPIAPYEVENIRDVRLNNKPTENMAMELKTDFPNSSLASGIGAIGAIDDKRAKRERQAQYARDLEQQMNQRNGFDRVTASNNAPSSNDSDNHSNYQGINMIGGANDRNFKKEKQMQYARELEQQMNRAVSNTNSDSTNSRNNGNSYGGINMIGHIDEKAIKKEKQLQYARELEHQLNSKDVVNGVGNNISTRAESRGAANSISMIGANDNKAVKREKQLEYAKELEQQINGRDFNNNRQGHNSRRNEPGIGGVDMIGDREDKNLKRERQLQYARELEQQMNIRNGNSNNNNRMYSDIDSATPSWNPNDEKQAKREKQMMYAQQLQAQILQQGSQPQPTSLNVKKSSGSDRNEKPQGLEPGWVIGPLGVPVRKTLEVGNRGLQKKYNSNYFSPEKQKQLPSILELDTSNVSDDRYFSAPETVGSSNSVYYPSNPRSYLPPPSMEDPYYPQSFANDQYSNRNGNGNGNGNGDNRMHDNAYLMGNNDAMDSRNNQGLAVLNSNIPIDIEEERKLKAKQAQIELSLALQRQVEENKRRSEEEKKKIQMMEEQQEMELARQREQIQKEFEREQEAAKQRLEEERKKELDRQIEYKKQQKELEQKKAEEAERRENDKLERQRQELLRRELEEKEKEAQAMAPMTKRGSSDNFDEHPSPDYKPRVVPSRLFDRSPPKKSDMSSPSSVSDVGPSFATTNNSNNSNNSNNNRSTNKYNYNNNDNNNNINNNSSPTAVSSLSSNPKVGSYKKSLYNQELANQEDSASNLWKEQHTKNVYSSPSEKKQFLFESHGSKAANAPSNQMNIGSNADGNPTANMNYNDSDCDKISLENHPIISRLHDEASRARQEAAQARQELESLRNAIESLRVENDKKGSGDANLNSTPKDPFSGKDVSKWGKEVPHSWLPREKNSSLEKNGAVKKIASKNQEMSPRADRMDHNKPRMEHNLYGIVKKKASSSNDNEAHDSVYDDPYDVEKNPSSNSSSKNNPVKRRAIPSSEAVVIGDSLNVAPSRLPSGGRRNMIDISGDGQSIVSDITEAEIEEIMERTLKSDSRFVYPDGSSFEKTKTSRSPVNSSRPRSTDSCCSSSNNNLNTSHLSGNIGRDKSNRNAKAGPIASMPPSRPSTGMASQGDEWSVWNSSSEIVSKPSNDLNDSTLEAIDLPVAPLLEIKSFNVDALLRRNRRKLDLLSKMDHSSLTDFDIDDVMDNINSVSSRPTTHGSARPSSLPQESRFFLDDYDKLEEISAYGPPSSISTYGGREEKRIYPSPPSVHPAYPVSKTTSSSSSSSSSASASSSASSSASHYQDPSGKNRVNNVWNEAGPSNMIPSKGSSKPSMTFSNDNHGGSNHPENNGKEKAKVDTNYILKRAGLNSIISSPDRVVPVDGIDRKPPMEAAIDVFDNAHPHPSVKKRNDEPKRTIECEDIDYDSDESSYSKYGL